MIYGSFSFDLPPITDTLNFATVLESYYYGFDLPPITDTLNFSGK